MSFLVHCGGRDGGDGGGDCGGGNGGGGGDGDGRGDGDCACHNYDDNMFWWDLPVIVEKGPAMHILPNHIWRF